MYKELLLKLIKEYISCANYVCSLLKELNTTSESILRAIKIKQIPKQGYLDKDIYYNAHGVGCYFEMQNIKIDIDFGPNDRNDGFDVHRLMTFLESKGDEFNALKDEKAFQENFKILINEGIIFNPCWPPSEHLYYLKENK
jgi:hypothetical protein